MSSKARKSKSGRGRGSKRTSIQVTDPHGVTTPSGNPSRLARKKRSSTNRARPKSADTRRTSSKGRKRPSSVKKKRASESLSGIFPDIEMEAGSGSGSGGDNTPVPEERDVLPPLMSSNSGSGSRRARSGSDETSEDEGLAPLGSQGHNDGGFASRIGLKINLPSLGRNSKSQPNTPTNAQLGMNTPLAMVMHEVAAVVAFSGDSLHVKVFSNDVMENAFRAANNNIGYQHAAQAFLSTNLEVQEFNIADPYTLFSSEVGDKQLCFLMEGSHDTPLPTVDTLHASIHSILGALKEQFGDNDFRQGRELMTPVPGHTSARRKRADSMQSSLTGLSSIEEVFRTMDLEGAGSIDEVEFSTGLRSLGVNWTDSQLSKLFSQIDAKGDGGITFSAFMKFMLQKENKSKWKEMKSTIQASISLPSPKKLRSSNVDVVEYQNKLSAAEKLIDLMEEAVVESCDSREEVFWVNKIHSHREFVRRHQDVAGRALGQENVRMKKRLSQLEDQSKRLVELEAAMASGSATPSNKSRSMSTRQMSRKKTADISGDEELKKRLRRENQELKRRVAARDKEISALQGKVTRANSGRSRGASIGRDDSGMTEQLAKLRAENRGLRNERDKYRNDRDQLSIQLKAAKDKVEKYSALAGPDADMLAQISRLKHEQQSLRKQKASLREDNIRLKGVDNALRKKLMALTNKLSAIDDNLAQSIMNKESLAEMIEELTDQLSAMVDRYLASESEVKRLQQELRKQAQRFDGERKQFQDEITELQREIDRLKGLLAEKNGKVEELHITVRDKSKIIKDLEQQLRDTEKLYNDSKKNKKVVSDKEAEILELKRMIEELQAQLADSADSNRALKNQMKLITKMPGGLDLMKQVDRLFRIFRKLDKNKDGFLNWEEFQPGAEELGFGETEYEQQKAFEAMDRENRGKVNFEEFKDACLRMLASQGKEMDDAEWAKIRNILNKPPSQWTSEDVATWLEHIGLNQYGDEFKNGMVDGRTLLSMRGNDARELGMVKSSHIRKFMNNLNDLQKRDDVIGNLKFENEKMKDELSYMKEHGPTWASVRSLQKRIRDLQHQLNKEKHARENVMASVKQELKDDQRFSELSPDEEDMIAEIALLKGALANTNKKLRSAKKAQPAEGMDVEYDSKPGDGTKHDLKPIGRFLQKWYVLANHNTNFWVSRTNAELEGRKEKYALQLELADESREEQKELGVDDLDTSKEVNEALDWILYDARRDRVIHEVRMRGRGLHNDPKDVHIQLGAHPSGPWTTVAQASLKQSPEEQVITGFEAEGRFWRLMFLSNHGEEEPRAPRYVMYEVQFWGPLDEDIDNSHFVIE